MSAINRIIRSVAGIFDADLKTLIGYIDQDGKEQLFNGADGSALQSSASLDLLGANGQSLKLKQLTENMTIAAAASSDSVIQMPANAIILAVPVLVTTVIPTAATFTVGDSGSAARFSTAAVAVAAGSNDKGTKAGAYYNAGALSIRITPNGAPGAATGRVRLSIIYLEATAPTS